MKTIACITLAIFYLGFGCRHRESGAPAAWNDPPNLGRRVDSLLRLMTLEEKVGQMNLLTSDWELTGPTMREDYRQAVETGRVGGVFNAHTARFTRSLQEIAVNRTRLGIPLLFGYDVVHGYKTILPIPLAEAASWDMEAIARSARVAAAEGSAAGLHWVFAPMVDIARDPRWGRVSEGAGEDPFLGARVAEARVRGFQGGGLDDTTTVLSCAKHFAGYGAAQAGRDYNTTDITPATMQDVILPPFRAAVDAGAATVMTAFNDPGGIPASGNRQLLEEVLRRQWGFRGLVVSDYTSINEMVLHGVAADLQDAALMAARAGVDMDMQGEAYARCLTGLVKAGKLSEADIDKSVRRILEMKMRLGLFEDPYRYSDTGRESRTIYAPAHLEAARDMARNSFVLLKNDGGILPLRRGGTIALVGALAASGDDMMGSWSAAGEAGRVVTILEGIRKGAGSATRILYARGCEVTGGDDSEFVEAIRAARLADVVVLVAGESRDMSGEAASRAHLGLPGLQSRLVEELQKTGKPLVVLVACGRPLTLVREAEMADALMVIWFGGTQTGTAVSDVLFGDHNPGGKLPITFPRHEGQLPLFYAMKNTGRPIDLQEKYTSKYLDESNLPLYPFGYGLSYTTFGYSDLRLSDTVMGRHGITVSAVVTNTGSRPGSEIAQLYVQDVTGSVTRPVRELKGFEKEVIEAGESHIVNFVLRPEDLEFTRSDGRRGTEPGIYRIFVGGSSEATLEASFVLE